jgi:hypothetical protein
MVLTSLTITSWPFTTVFLSLALEMVRLHTNRGGQANLSIEWSGCTPTDPNSVIKAV